MKIFKSAWFWSALLWGLGGLVAFLLLRSLSPEWGMWTWVGWGVEIALGAGVTFLLWQRARLKALAKGVRNDAADRFEEQWKVAMRTDLQRVLAALPPVVEGGLAGCRLHWVVPASESSVSSLLAPGTSVEVTRERAHELSGELARLVAVHAVGGSAVFVLRELPDPKIPASLERMAFLVTLLRDAGKVRPVDTVIALVPFPGQGGGTSSKIQPAIAALADLSQVEFPIHVLFDGFGDLPGGEAYCRTLQEAAPEELPGAALAYAAQERLPESLADAWKRMLADQDARLEALLARALRSGREGSELLGFLHGFAGRSEAVQSVLKSVCGQFIGAAVPFLRSFAFLPPRAAEAMPQAALGGAAFFEGDTESAAAPKAKAHPSAFWRILSEEPALARLSSRTQRKRSTAATAFLVGALAISFLLVGASLHGLLMGGRLDDEWRQRLGRVEMTRWQDSASIAQEIGLWKELRDLRDDIRDNRPWLLAPGFYRGGARLEQVERKMDTMTMRLVRYSFASQEGRLRNAALGIRDSLSDTKDLYVALKTYLMISKGGWRIAQAIEGEKGLEDAYSRSWSAYLGFGEMLPDGARVAVPAYAQDVALRVADGDSAWLGSEDPSLIETARRLLRSSKNQSGNYARLLGAADSMQDLTLDSLGLSQQELTCQVVLVSKPFTRKAYFGAVLPAMEALASNADDWVVGEGALASTNSAEVLAELRRRYFEDYAKAWDAVLAGIACEFPPENQRVATALTSLSGPFNPQNPKGIVAFLKRVADETDLSVAPAQPAATAPVALPAAAAKVAAGAKKVAAVVKDKLLSDPAQQQAILQLKDRYAVVRGQADAATKGEYDVLLKDMAQLAGVLSQWTEGDAALQFSKGVASQDPKNPLVHAINEAETRSNLLPADQRGWFQALTTSLLQQVKGKLAPQGGSFAGDLYREKVYAPWQSLAKGNYPFDPYASNEASITEVDAFLNPKTGSLSSFLKDVEGMFAPEAKEDGQLSVDRSGRDAIQKLLRLQNFFYGKNGAAWKGCPLMLSVRADQRAKVSFRIGAQVVDLPAGAGEKRIALRWPMPGANGASIQATTLSNSFEEHKDGEWAFLRLVDPRVTNGNGSVTEAVWSFSDRSYIVDVPVTIRCEQPGNPFREKDFFQVNLPPELFR